MTLKQTAKPLQFSFTDPKETNLFNSELLEFDISDFNSEPAFFHQHNYGISPYWWEKESVLRENLRILSVEEDRIGNEFVNIYEGINYPIIAFQFHPEKATSAFSKYQEHFPHSNKSIYLNRYFADYFVNLAR